MKSLFLIFLLALTVGAKQDPVDLREVPLNQLFDIAAGEQVIVQGTKIKIGFLSVSEDSRCPEDAACVWQGNGRVNLELKKSKKTSKQVSVNTGIEPSQASFKKFKVKLVKLSPNTKANSTIPPDQYVATLIVTRR